MEYHNIRKAKSSDYNQVAPLIIQAMNDLAKKFTNSNDAKLASKLFEYFFQQENNQYSYMNTLVYAENNQIIGSITAYDGALLHTLRAPFFKYIKENYRSGNLIMEDETEAGEFYLDTISVSSLYQGKGIGAKLIQAAVTWAKELGHQRVGLLVDTENPNAKRLYSRLGFETKSIKRFMGVTYEHMQIDVLGR